MAENSMMELNSEQNPLDTTGLCLLSIDGGGIRGLSTLFILRGLTTRLNAERRKVGLCVVKPCEVFDLIGGTSTGGLIAIMFGRLQMDVEECIVAYRKLMVDIFQEQSSWFQVKPRFDSTKLRNAIKEMIEDKRIVATEPFANDGSHGCRTFVCVRAKETSGITCLRNYLLPDESEINIPATICEAALATCAVTTFFDPVFIGARQFVDSSLGANNPIDELEVEAANIWSAGIGDLKPLVKCLVSVGAGQLGTKAVDDRLLSETLIRIGTETEETERRFAARWAKQYEEKRYLRFNVSQGLQNVGIAEHMEEGKIEAATDEYLRHQSQKSRVSDCVKNLLRKQNQATTTIASVIREYEAQRTMRSKSLGKRIQTIPFQRNRKFVGRASSLDQLEQTLFGENQPRKAAIYGLGGVGKTQVVLELAYRTAEKYQDCSIFWIPATDRGSLQQAFTDVAMQLGIAQPQANPQKLIQQHLSQEGYGKWLLIIDNLDDIGIWNDIKTTLPKTQQGCIVCTTRSRHIAVKIAGTTIINIAELDKETAVNLLSNSLIRKSESTNAHDEMLELLEQLVFLPIAIVQAAAYINQNDITIADYLSLLKEQEKDVVDLLSEDFEDDWRYQNKEIKNPVATTWLISFEHIQLLDPIATNYLSFISCVSPRDIPQSLLPPAPSRKKDIDAVALLRAYSFITLRTDGHTNGGALNVHRLVHLATRNWLREKQKLGEWSHTVLKRLEEVFPKGWEDANVNRDIWRTYLPHTLYVLEEKEVNMQNKFELVHGFAACLFHDGLYNDAESWALKLVKTQKRVYGADHEETLSSERLLSEIYHSQARQKEAEELQVDIIKRAKDILGSEHNVTVGCMVDLASTYKSQGRYKEAEELEVEALGIGKRVYGPEHPCTLNCIANLAVTYKRQKRWKDAHNLEIQVLEAKRRVLGEWHPDTLIAMTNLAVTYCEQGKVEEGFELGLQVVEMHKKVSGVDHPFTLKSIGHLSICYRKLGRLQEARQMQEENLEKTRKALGLKHPQTLAAMNSLAFTLKHQGHLNDAIVMLEECAHLRVEVLGHDHPRTIRCLQHLEIWRLGKS